MRAARAIAPIAGIAVATTLLAGCAMTRVPPSSGEESAVPSPEALVARVAEYAAPRIHDWGVTSVALGVITADGLAASWFSGENTAGDPVDAETLFEIGSATKAFLGVSEALLVERGELAWDDPVVEHYPGFGLSDPWVTQEFRIGDLLAQRTGLPPYAADMFGHLGYDYEDGIEALRYIEPVTSFRSEFAYQNLPHLVAGKIVAGIEGAATWGEAAEPLIFEPLGMDSTRIGYDALASSANTTVGHEHWDGAVRALAPGRLPADAQGAGGIVSNLADMSRWVAMHLNRGETPAGRFISEEQLEETYRPRVQVTGDFAEGMKQGDGVPRIGYATGWLVHSLPEGRVIEHGGTTNGYTSSVRFDPDRGIGVVVLTNLAYHGGLATPIAQYAMDLIQQREPVDYEARIQETLRARDAAAGDAPAYEIADPAELERYTGEYTHPVAGTIEVRVEDGRLSTTIGPRAIRASFTPVAEDAFELSWLFDNDPDAWHLSAPVVFSGEGEVPDTLLLADLAFARS